MRPAGKPALQCTAPDRPHHHGGPRWLTIVVDNRFTLSWRVCCCFLLLVRLLLHRCRASHGASAPLALCEVINQIGWGPSGGWAAPVARSNSPATMRRARRALDCATHKRTF